MVNLLRVSNLPLLFFILAMSACYLLALLNAFGFFGQSVSGLMQYAIFALGPLFAGLSLFFGFLEGKLNKLRPFYRYWLLANILFAGFLFLNGLAHSNAIRYFGYDVCMLLLLFSGLLIGSDSKNWQALDKFFVLQFMSSAILCVIAWLNLGDFSDQFSLRSNLTSIQPTCYLIWGTLYAWPYFLATINQGSSRRRYIACVGVLLFFIFAILFQKRTPFVFLAVFIGLYIFSSLKRKKRHLTRKKVKRIFAQGMIVLVVITALAFVVEKHTFLDLSMQPLMLRFVKKGSLRSTILKNDRLAVEPLIVYEDASLFNIFLGKGLGGTIRLSPKDYTKTQMPTTHNGAAFVGLKGGIAWALILFPGFIKLIIDFFKVKDKRLFKLYVPIVIPTLFLWFGNIFSVGIGLGIYMLFAGACMSKERSVIAGLGVNNERPFIRSNVRKTRMSLVENKQVGG